MSNSPPNPELLQALGRLVRGLALLFWGVPLALVICVQTTHTDYLRMFGIIPPILSTGLLLYGLGLLGYFRKEERVWTIALERARIFALLNVGLAPFLFWWSKIPGNSFYTIMSQLMACSGLVFLFTLNEVLRRLTAMLPDATLRQETLMFTRINAALLALSFAVLAFCFATFHLKWQPAAGTAWSVLIDRASHWGVLFLVLVATALTMTMLWKAKEAIFSSVFGGGQ
jgi:hypothetical protein